ncbi:MAG: hypothetical protein OEV36_12715, partial [Myxococcales bacterium]|nr:hypothetical protein [Myxococcales bacterium]
GPPELSEWMAELFPQGEARKSQLMELARMPRAPVLSMSAYSQLDKSHSVTVAKDLQPPYARGRSRHRMFALIGGVVVMAAVIALVLGRGDASKPIVTELAKADAETAPTAETGIVHLVTRGGWAEIWMGDESMGSTPTRLTLPAGRHLLVLKPFGTGAPKPVFVEVTAGETKLVSIGLD